jgi:serine/threonine protein phosphatase PrpC
MAECTAADSARGPLDIGVAAHDLHMEDRTLVSSGMRLFGVFDGVSAGGGGADVAALAVDAVHDWVCQRSTPLTVRDAHELLAGALTEADTAIARYNEAHDRPAHPSATTAAVVLIFQPVRPEPPGLVAVATTIGDSRVQLLRDDRLFTLTLDHSFFGEDDPAEAKARQDRLDLARSLLELEDPIDRAAFTHRNLISGALDGSGRPDARFYAFRLVAGDRLLVDTDGIHDNLNIQDLAQLVAAPEDAQQTADAVAEAAFEQSQHDPQQTPRAKPDDMSIIVVDVPEDRPKAG